MCLYTKQICPLRARKDIVCYKVFSPSFDEFHIMTPYTHMHILRPTKDNPTLMDDTDVDINNCGLKIKFIDRGMIHAYTSQRSVFAYRLRYKCIIPKGTLYYKGINGDICAKKMLIVEQIP